MFYAKSAKAKSMMMESLLAPQKKKFARLETDNHSASISDTQIGDHIARIARICFNFTAQPVPDEDIHHGEPQSMSDCASPAYPTTNTLTLL
jgi:hypothetical protein